MNSTPTVTAPELLRVSTMYIKAFLPVLLFGLFFGGFALDEPHPSGIESFFIFLTFLLPISFLVGHLGCRRMAYGDQTKTRVFFGKIFHWLPTANVGLWSIIFIGGGLLTALSGRG